ncbi:DUF881 domain-containing protein [Clostridium guangxiense]|uniref:DUF881 domain-containing protein n=1 Tax=Clostridium guangxiense TaxID=1662055 RepID=UPI001E4C9F8E|nr:DUF881 domain-containing protein [Clostridium guangxiense]MCD2345194.1 DUF881 domain-containing protein [Clostridium guangxiense]
MKNNEASIFIFIASIFIGILISSSITFGNTKKTVYLNSKQYQDVYRERSKLISDINDLREQYFDSKQKIIDFSKTTNDISETNTQMQDELKLYRMALGKVDIEGEGVEIILNDSGGEFTGTVKSSNNVGEMLHDYDIRYVLNALKSAGAEAISVNGQRVLSNSEIYCNAEFILINGIKTGAPFNIKAIGDEDKLKSYMLADGSYLKFLEMRSNGNIKFKLSTNSDVKMFSSNNNIKYKNMSAK